MSAKDGFTIKLPPEALEMIELLMPLGIYGTSRAEIARNLVQDHLKKLIAEKVILWPREP